jgi:hypothetical protein
MQIGIMTHWWSKDNYGQQMQIWALQKYLEILGHEGFLIRYLPLEDYGLKTKNNRFHKALNPRRLFRYLGTNTRKVFQAMIDNKHPRLFNEFQLNHMRLSERIYNSIDELRADPPDAGFYICGSDQVWNFPDQFGSGKKVIQAFFLDFGPSTTRRASYAASFGRDVISQSLLDFVSPLLGKFENVSVREEGGIEICKKAGRPDAHLACDPTLLLSQDKYEELFQNIRKVEGKYCFLYLVGNKCKVPIRQIKNYCRGQNLAIVYTASPYRLDTLRKTYPSIQEWLSLIANAECVITNSYHGMIFAVIFRKRFVVLPLKGEVFGEMNNRVISLLTQLGRKGKTYNGSLVESFEDDFDWAGMRKNIHPLSRTFLENIR